MLKKNTYQLTCPGNRRASLCSCSPQIQLQLLDGVLRIALHLYKACTAAAVAAALAAAAGGGGQVPQNCCPDSQRTPPRRALGCPLTVGLQNLRCPRNETHNLVGATPVVETRLMKDGNGSLLQGSCLESAFAVSAEQQMAFGP